MSVESVVCWPTNRVLEANVLDDDIVIVRGSVGAMFKLRLESRRTLCVEQQNKTRKNYR